jgi:predicted permease
MRYLRPAVRQLLERAGTSWLLIAMLAIGIGATSAMYSTYYHILLEPLAVPEPQRLVKLGAPGIKPGTARPGNAYANTDAVFSYPMYQDLKAEQRVFTAIAAHYDFLANIGHRGEATGGQGILVSGEYFSVLGLQPVLGRLIAPQDEPRVGESLVAVLSHDFWQRHLAGDPNVIGETLTVNHQPLTVIGVAPAGFRGVIPGAGPDVFVPLTLRWLMQPEEPRNDQDRFSYWVHLFARLQPGVSAGQAYAELNGFYRSLLRDVEAPMLGALPAAQLEQFLDRHLTVEPGSRRLAYIPTQIQTGISLLLGVAVIVLLIICVNAANLLLARGTARTGEMAVRACVGASRGQLLAQLFTEALVPGALACVLSLPVALASLAVIVAMIGSVGIAGHLQPTLDLPVLAFACGATLATVLLCALVPALTASQANPALAVKGQAAQPPGAPGSARLRHTLIGAQIALAMMLLVLAGLFQQSTSNVARLNYGMDIDAVVGFSVSGSLGGYSGARLDTLYRSIAEELAAEPGIASVGSVAIPLLSSIGIPAAASIVGAEGDGPANDFAQSNYMTSPGFFATVGIPLLIGRDFVDSDSAGPQSVVIVNESFVRRFELDDAVGRQVRFSGPYLPDMPMEIVGVVADAVYAGVNAANVPQFFTPRPIGDASFNSLFFYVRGALEPDALLVRIREIMARIDPNLPPRSLTTLREQVRSSTTGYRVMSALSAAFAVLATLLAAIGIYGVVAYSVGRRTREFGLRQALGARPADLRWLVLRQTGRVALIAGGIGLVAALAVGAVAQALLYGLTGRDPVVLACAAIVLGAVVCAAGFLPAHTASRIAPMEALRHE